MSETEGKVPHERRPRYKGAYPRAYREKYKELQPEKYAGTVEHVLEKGNTPAGMHRPVMVEEVKTALRICPGEVGLDATLGYGGHAQMMLACLEGSGHLYGLDVDGTQLERTSARLAAAGFGPELFTARHLNFADADQVAREAGGFDFILADLGVSSMQIDNPERGFSYKQDGPLDLRMDPAGPVTGAERLAELSEEEIAGMLTENADEPYAREIARRIAVDRARGADLSTTSALRGEVEAALSFLPEKERRAAVKKSCQRTFQALRIDVNCEFEVLYAFLGKLPGMLKPGGRAVILSFHSGEDRLVKQSFRQFLREGVYESVSDGVIRPTAEECARNSRARSTKLRWAVRTGVKS